MPETAAERGRRISRERDNEAREKRGEAADAAAESQINAGDLGAAAAKKSGIAPPSMIGAPTMQDKLPNGEPKYVGPAGAAQLSRDRKAWMLEQASKAGQTANVKAMR